MKMYKHIMWDFDGTLFNSYPVMGSVFKETLEKRGITEPIDEILKYMKVSMTHAITHYIEKYKIDSAFIEEYDKVRKARELDICEPYDGIEKLCRYIHESGRKNYLYTHRGESSIFILKKYGLYDYFSDFITSKHGFERKPSPDAINYLVDKYNMTKSEAMMVGDRDLDILSAKNAGICGCFFNEDGKEYDKADFSIRNFDELYMRLGE